MKDTFLQIGSTRDGREPYLDAARRRGMRAVLVERQEYLTLRAAAGRDEFDCSIGVSSPANADDVWTRVQSLGRPRLALAGFERYTPCAHEIAARIDPRRPLFRPPTKSEQRAALALRAPEIAQPRFSNACAPDGVSFPAVLKPVDGGGGLGVLLLPDAASLAAALAYGRRLANYDGAPLEQWLLEEYVDAPEWSVQGLCCAGECIILAACAKVVTLEPMPDLPGVFGFREAAHIASSGATLPDLVCRFVERAVAAVGYTDGPFHLDFRQADRPVFIEMGFRLSGAAITDLVHAVSGCDWGECVFSWMLREGRRPVPAPGGCCAANVLAFCEWQIEFARAVLPHDALRVERFASPAASLPAAVARQLGADLSRHSGPLARLQILGDDPDEIRKLAIAICNLQSR